MIKAVLVKMMPRFPGFTRVRPSYRHFRLAAEAISPSGLRLIIVRHAESVNNVLQFKASEWQSHTSVVWPRKLVCCRSRINYSVASAMLRRQLTSGWMLVRFPALPYLQGFCYPVSFIFRSTRHCHLVAWSRHNFLRIILCRSFAGKQCRTANPPHCKNIRVYSTKALRL